MRERLSILIMVIVGICNWICDLFSKKGVVCFLLVMVVGCRNQSKDYVSSGDTTINGEKYKSLDFPTTKEKLVKYFDTTTRVWFVEYRNDSSLMVLIDSITKVQVQIPLK